MLNIQAFVEETLSTELLDPGRKRLQEAITAHVSTQVNCVLLFALLTFVLQLNALNRPPNSPYPGVNSGQKFKLTELNPSEIAKQLMRIENELFQKILASDIAAWVKNVDDEQLQNLPRFLTNNYKVSINIPMLKQADTEYVFSRLRTGASLRSYLSTPTRLRKGLK